MEQIEKAKKIYSKILGLIKNNQDVCKFDLSGLEYKAKTHLFGLELKFKYGLDLDPDRVSSTDWQKFGDDVSIGFYDGERRKISWSIDGSQPNNEYLLKISFPTGPYIFGDGGLLDKDYPVEFFQKFFTELMSYKPDFADMANKSLYWRLENAKDIFNSYYSILKKYHELNREDIKLRRIEKMRKELEALESGK